MTKVTRLTLIVALLCGPVLLAQANDLESAVALFEEHQYNEAAALLQPMAKTEPPSAAACHYLGRIFYDLQDYKTSLDWLEKAILLEEDNAEYQFWYGAVNGRLAQQASVFKRLGLAKKTKNGFLRAIELNPDHVRAREALIRFYLEAPGIAGGSRKKAYEEAEEIKKRDSVWAHRAYARIYDDEKEYEKAETEHLAAIAEDPQNEILYHELVYFYQRLEQYDKAFATLEKLLQNVPGDHMGLYQIGKTSRLAAAHLDEGIRALNAYLAANPTLNLPSPAWAHTCLGALFALKSDADSSRFHYETALKLDPDQKEAKKALKKL